MPKITFHSEYLDTLKLFFADPISDLRSLGCLVTTSTVCDDLLFTPQSSVPHKRKIFKPFKLTLLRRFFRSFFYLLEFSRKYPDTTSIVVTPTLILAAPFASFFARFRYIVVCQGQLEGEGLFISYLYRCFLLLSVFRAQISFTCNVIEKYRWDFLPFVYLKYKLIALPWYGVALSRSKLLSYRSQPHHTKQPENAVRLCYLGRISESKGCLDLIRTFMHPSLSSISLSLAGPVESDSSLSQLLHDLPSNISISPSIPSHDVPKWLSSFDLFISFSRGESIGSATLEALLCGVPVISSFNSGSCQVLRHAVDSYLLDDLNPSSVLSAIEYCLQNYRNMSTSARQLSCLEFPDTSFLASSIFRELSC